MIRISAFPWVPTFAQGLARDLRVRWALEEAGLPYEERLVTRADQKSSEYLALQPFGQVPTYEEDGLELFESGAIVLHIGERSEALLPKDAKGRARAITWMLAALNTVEPQIAKLAEIDLFHAGEEWAQLRRPAAVDAVKRRLDVIANHLEARDYLEDRFTIGDLMMVAVLRILRHTDLVSSDPVLAAYVARCEARPAFQRALSAQMAHFAEAPPAVAAT